jgi:CO dehydrogenase maturation factor
VVRHLVRGGRRPVLAVDADPNSTLGDKLGVRVERTIGDLREAASAGRYEAPAGIPRQRAVEYAVQRTVAEGKGFDLLVMGRGEGPGCYCSLNNMLRQFLGSLAAAYPHVVIDNEAGMEHLSRRTDHKVDAMLVVSDDTPAALTSGRRIAELARALNVLRGRIGLVLNRIREERPAAEAAAAAGLEVLGVVPWDPLVDAWDREGRPLLDLPDASPAAEGVSRLMRALGI